MTAHKRALLILILIGAILRLWVISARPDEAIPVAPDEGEYVHIAQNLAHGDGFTFQGEPTAYRDVLFPFAASLLFRISGNHPAAVFGFQLILDCLTALLLYRVGRVRFSAGISLALAGAWLLYPAAVLFTSLFLTETLFVFLWVSALAMHDRFERREYRIVDSIALGILLGLLTLTRAAGLVLAASVLIYLVLIRYETPKRVRFTAAAVVLGAFLLTVVPWMVRNTVQVGSFTLNTNGGINLFIGNNPHATGAYRFDETAAAPLYEADLDEAERDRLAASLARSYFLSHKKESVNLWSKKFAYLWSTDMALLAHYLPNRSGESLAVYLSSFPALVLAVMSLPFMLMVWGGTAGFYLVRHFPARGLFILQLFIGLLAALAAYGLPRYHFPYMPAVLIGAAAVLQPGVWRAAPQWRKVFLLATIGMFGGIWLYEFKVIAGL